jgi:hypothetical protein
MLLRVFVDAVILAPVSEVWVSATFNATRSDDSSTTVEHAVADDLPEALVAELLALGLKDAASTPTAT